MTRQALAITLFCAGFCSITVASSSGRAGQNAGGTAATIPDPGAVAARATSAQDEESIRALLVKLEQVVRSGNPDAYLALVAATADKRRASDFAGAEVRRGATRLLLLERDREPLTDPPGNGLRIVVDTFVEFGARGRVATWQLDLVKTGANEWVLVDQQRLSSVDFLYRLFLNPDKQFSARDFRIRAEDVELTLAEGSVFTVDTDQGITALVLLGRGTMRFQPTPPIEKRQVEIFAGSEVLESRFDAAYIRLGQVGAHADMSQLTERAVDPREFRRADLVFREESAKSFAFDLSEFTSDAWTLLPGALDFLAEVRTRRFGTLTYSRAALAAEDISVFDRTRQKNISIYSSADRLPTRGPIYTEDGPPAYDVRDYDIDLAFNPARLWFEGRTRLQITIGSAPTNQLRLHLAPSLNVHSVTSEQFGRLFSVRVRNQDTLLVTLPVLLLPDADITITVTYSGPLGSQPADWETLAESQRDVDPSQDFPSGPRPVLRLEARYLYSNRSFWYPRPSVADYATATLRVTVPAAFECLASGRPGADSPTLVDDQRKRFEFATERPLRYLSFFVTKVSPIDRVVVKFPGAENGPGRFGDPATGGALNTLNLAVVAHAGLASKARDMAGRASAIARFFESIVGNYPYSSLTLALVEGLQPGGHSPGYFAVLSQPAVDQPRFWRNDPAAFDKHIDFFPAHEIAHQWWGQAVGWNTYHDQWLSEGFAQYFAALYIGHSRGDAAFRSIMGDMRDWGLRRSDQGPVFLGYRLGHVREDSRVFRALVYNKAAAVLHMLRRLVGDDAFFSGVRQFYERWRFQKPATEDFRHVMESASGRSLQRFFQRWIYDMTLPQLKFSYRVQDDVATGQGREILLRFDQSGELFDIPVTVILQYADRPPEEVIVEVTDRTAEKRVPLNGTLRRVDISKDDGTLAEVKR